MKQIHEARPPLAFIAPGSDVRLCEIDEAIDPAQQEQLLAYGLLSTVSYVYSSSIR